MNFENTVLGYKKGSKMKIIVSGYKVWSKMKIDFWKYSFGLQKGIKKLKMDFWKYRFRLQKGIRNENYRFRLQSGVKNENWFLKTPWRILTKASWRFTFSLFGFIIHLRKSRENISGIKFYSCRLYFKKIRESRVLTLFCYLYHTSCNNPPPLDKGGDPRMGGSLHDVW